MKILNSILALMFLFFASLQLNDPDPVVWITIYGAMAVVCIMAVFDYYLRWLMLAQATGYVIYCIILFSSFWHWLISPGRSMLFDEFAKMQNLYVEETREFLGLVICLTVLAGLWFRSSRVTRKS